MKMTDTIGLYIHIPFCLSKCGYCDFYSFVPDEGTMNRYLDALLKRTDEYSAVINCPVDTLSLIHISEPTRPYTISYAVFCL